MFNIVCELVKEPKWVADNMHYVVKMGSHAYGIAQPESDLDIYGWAIPAKTILFPFLGGYVPGIDKNIPEFNNVNISNSDYDITIFSVLRYIELTLGGNPNMVDSLFVPVDCIIHMTKMGLMLRDKRHLFLSKLCYHRFRGYAYQQLNKVENRKRSPEYKALIEFEEENHLPINLPYDDVYNNKLDLSPALHQKHMLLYQAGLRVTGRFEDVKINGYDSKFLYHCVRLLLECEEILRDYNLTLDANQEILREIRTGQWKLDQAQRFFDQKMGDLETLLNKSVLPENPNRSVIKQLFFDIVETHYGRIVVWPVPS